MIQKASDILNRAGAARGRARRAFTLLEILIAVAALGLIAVGVASIFDATGKVLKTGRTVSAFNSYASLIEQQLRADISAMTHEGFLVIRSDYASAQGTAQVNVLPVVGNPDGVALYEGDENPRLRRIDELMFFAKGDFVSARSAMDPAYVARSDAARIYYGHGQRARVPVTFNANDPYYLPELTGVVWNGQTYDAEAHLGRNNPGIDPPNPNKFASDWILLRQVTLLCPPRTSQVVPTNSIFEFGPTNPALLDSSLQVSLQPASSDIFRKLGGIFPLAPYPAAIRGGSRAFVSGLLDVAATDLSKIRTVVSTSSVYPNAANGRFYAPTANGDPNEAANAGVDGQYRLWGASPLDPDVISRAQSWMDDAFPCNSMAQTATQRERIRCELSPRNFVGVGEQAVTSGWTESEEAYRRADQIMLSSSNFLPRCTEFIVEWSFGKTYPSDPAAANYISGLDGQIIWHGMQRFAAGKLVSQYYNDAAPLLAQTVPFTRVSGATGNHLVQTRLIHGENAATTAPNPGAPLTSYFGFYDPTFNPDADGDGRLESPNDSISPTLPWAWPKLIRVTLSLADPADPTIERTYQFVFEVPDRDGV